MNGVTMKGKKDENKEKIANNETKKSRDEDRWFHPS
jgi:hypothetical protein